MKVHCNALDNSMDFDSDHYITIRPLYVKQACSRYQLQCKPKVEIGRHETCNPILKIGVAISIMHAVRSISLEQSDQRWVTLFAFHWQMGLPDVCQFLCSD